MKKIFQGLSYNGQGLSYFKHNRSLWKYVLIPMGLNLLALVLFVYLYLHFYQDLFFFLTQPFGKWDVAEPAGFWQHTLDAALWLARGFIQVVVFLIATLLIVMSVYLVSLFINAPFYEMLSEKVLSLKGEREDKVFSFTRFFTEVAFSLRVELIKALIFILITLILVALSWIPVVGFVFTFLQFLFSAWFFAFGICIYPMVLDRVPLSQIFSWGRRHKWNLIGFGLPAMIPLLGLILMNFQVVGGTLLYLDKKNAQKT